MRLLNRRGLLAHAPALLLDFLARTGTGLVGSLNALACAPHIALRSLDAAALALPPASFRLVSALLGATWRRRRRARAATHAAVVVRLGAFGVGFVTHLLLLCVVDVALIAIDFSLFPINIAFRRCHPPLGVGHPALGV